MVKKMSGLIALVVATMVVASCGQSGGDGSAAQNNNNETASSVNQDNQKAAATEKVSNEPVELTLFSGWALTDDTVQQRFIEPLKKSHPNITLKMLFPQGNPIANLVGSGQAPDLVTGPAQYMSKFGDLGLFYDMNGMLKESKFDLNRIEPEVMSAVQSYGDKGEIYGLPYTIIGFALYYNKDIFDKFGVAYPKDHMTWDEVIELARKVTRSENGVQYKGLAFQDANNLASQLSLDYVDMKTKKATINNDGWKKALGLMNNIISIPGNVTASASKRWFNNAEFLKDKNVAMVTTVEMFENGLDKASGEGLNWDMVTYPSYKEKPNTWGQPDGRTILVSSASKHKEQAFQVVQSVMSDEVELAMSKLGQIPSLKNQAIKDAFGSDLAYAKGKNVKAYFANKPATWRHISKYDQQAATIYMTHAVNLYKGQDVNTILRETEEELNQYIAANP